MDSYTSMKSKLEKLKLYDFEKGKYIKAELLVYADEIDRIDAELEKLMKEYFISTAEDYGLTARERFIGVERSELELSHRREMLLGRENILSTGFTREAFENVLYSLGLKDFQIIEDFEGFRTIIDVDDTVSEEEQDVIRDSAERIFPAHLDITIRFN